MSYLFSECILWDQADFLQPKGPGVEILGGFLSTPSPIHAAACFEHASGRGQAGTENTDMEKRWGKRGHIFSLQLWGDVRVFSAAGKLPQSYRLNTAHGG